MGKIILAAICFLAAEAGASAHEMPSGFTYDRYCCNGDGRSGDCQMIPGTNVRIVREGYRVTLLPGDHRLVTRPHVYVVPQTRARPSPDGSYHLCLFPNEDTVRCFYAPPLEF